MLRMGELTSILFVIVLVGGGFFLGSGRMPLQPFTEPYMSIGDFIDTAQYLTQEAKKVSTLDATVITLEDEKIQMQERIDFLEETKQPIQIPSQTSQLLISIIYLGLGFVLGRQSTWVKPSDEKTKDESPQ